VVFKCQLPRPAQCYPVYSVADGTLSRAGWQNPNNHNSGLGYRLTVGDSNGYTQYGHMNPDTLAVGVGDRVTTGQYLGDYANPTNGSSSGPHVHVERRLNSNPSVTIDPGVVSPLGSGGRVTSPFGAQDSALHSSPHQGVDYAYQAGATGC
jgi:murein DD-endopeptidase MepM/ murein hydrolase activator NlpD